MTAIACRRCGFRSEVPGTLAGRRVRCKRCGGVTTIPVAPLEYDLAPVTPVSVSEEEAGPSRPPRRRDRPRPDGEPWLSLGIGLGIAVAASVIPLVGVVPRVLRTVVHELGHAGAAWLTGSPAFPSFDLIEGGGFTRRFEPMRGLLLLLYAAFAFMLFRVRTNPRLLTLGLVAVAAHALVAFTGLRDVLVIAMGHGLEIVVAGLFLHRCLSGDQVLRPAERPLYAFLGINFLVGDFWIAHGVMSDPQYRELYEEQLKRGVHNDLARLAHDHLHVRVEAVAACYLASCLLAPSIAFWLHWSRHRLRRRGIGPA